METGSFGVESRPPGRSEELRPRRPSVSAYPGAWPDDDDGEEGSAGVREPRHPKPMPLSGVGEKPPPEPPVYLKLSDARH